MPPITDYKLLAARILRPKRLDPWPARKATRGITDPAEVWAVLKKTLPPALAESATRRYLRCPFVAATGGEPAPGSDLVPTPPTPSACLTMALDPEGILFAEERALEAVRRLEPWGVVPRTQFVWSIVPTWPGDAQGGEPLFATPAACLDLAAKVDKKTTIALGAAFRQGTEPVVGELSERGEPQSLLKLCEPMVEASGYAAQWRRAVETGVPVPSYEHAPGRLVPCVGKPFSELPDPFEPLVELIMRGYWLSGATDDALVMVAVDVTAKL